MKNTIKAYAIYDPQIQQINLGTIAKTRQKSIYSNLGCKNARQWQELKALGFVTVPVKVSV